MSEDAYEISYLDQLHMNMCEGCDYCDHLLDIYGWCCICETGYHKEDLYYFDQHSGDYYCDNCQSFIPPIYKTDYKLCTNCNTITLITNIWVDRLLGKTFCHECNGWEPEYNDPYCHAICETCKERGSKNHMVYNYRDDRDDWYVCKECNIIHCRTEILDL